MAVTAADRALAQELDPTAVNAIIFKRLHPFQLAAYIMGIGDPPNTDRRIRRLVH